MPARNSHRARAVEQRLHHAVIEPREPVVGGGVMAGSAGGRGHRGKPPPQHADGGPRGDGEGDDEGEQHRGGRANRDRAHVRTHESADEGHGQDGGDHRPRGENRGVADLVHGLERDLAEGFAPGVGQAHVPHDVFDDHDGVIDEDADGEDEREKRDAVERVAVEIEDEERESEGRGNREQDDERLAPAEEQQDEQGHAEDGDAHVAEQIVAFFSGGVAVIAGDGDGHVGGEERPARGGDLGKDRVDDIDGVGPGALGQAESDGGLQVAGGTAVQDIVGRFRALVGDGGHVAQIDRPVVKDPHHDGAGVGGIAQERAGLKQDLGVGERARTGMQLAVRLLERRHDLGGGELAGGERGDIEAHAHGPVDSADERGLGDLGDGFHDVVQLGGEPAEGEVILGGAVQREGQDGHVVNRAGPHERRARAGRDAVEAGLELLVEANEGGFDLRADLKADDHQRAAGAGGGVQVFHARDFPEQLFHGVRDPVFHLGGGDARHGDEDVDHGDLDLRLLLARQQKYGKEAEQDRGDDRDRRELRIDELRGEPAGEPVTRSRPGGSRRAHGRISTAWPSCSVAAGFTITVSPASRPAAIMIAPSSRALVFTRRSRA